MADVFISYARADWDHAKQLADALTARGYQVWWDVELVGSDNFRDVIMSELEAAKAVIVIWSASSCCSNFVLDEAGRALRAGKLVATRLDNFDPQNLPLGFGTQHTDLVTQLDRISPALIKLGIDTTAKKSTAEQARLLSETAFWREISASEDIQDFKLYISEYPDGLHRAHARLRIRKLRTGKPDRLEPAAALFSSTGETPAQSETKTDNVRPAAVRIPQNNTSPILMALAVLFAVLATPSIFLIGDLFIRQEWNLLGRVGGNELVTGTLVGYGVIVLFAAIIIRAREPALGPAERAIYWLGSAFAIGFFLSDFQSMFIGLMILGVGTLDQLFHGTVLMIAVGLFLWRQDSR